MAQTVVPSVPLWAYEAWVARGVDWLAMSEDLPRLDNRVTIEPDGRIRLTYRPNNVRGACNGSCTKRRRSSAVSGSGS